MLRILNRGVWIGSLWSLGCVSAMAQPLTECPSNLPAAQMAACLTQAKKIVDLEASLATARERLNKASGAATVRALPLPSVASTYGDDHHLEAVLDWPNGDALVVHPGSVIPGHYRVTSISLGTVVVDGPGGRHVLLLSGGVSGSTGSAAEEQPGSGFPVVNSVPFSPVHGFAAQALPTAQRKPDSQSSAPMPSPNGVIPAAPGLPPMTGVR
jgi:type IV pilus biogenesis protein PilP